MNTSIRRRTRWTRPMLLKMAGAAVVLAGLLAWQGSVQSAENAVTIPAPAKDETVGSVRSETAVLAGGCFWGVQGVFQHVRGVTQAVSGYSGGAASTAQYETVSGGDTGHAESVRITYDPAKITYGRLLQIYFSVVQNPTELNYQGPDHGTQYRSAIFPQNAMQRSVAQAYIAQLDAAHVFPAPIVTRVETFKGFYPAEGYHQNFLTLHPDNPYIAYNDLPKIANLKQLFPHWYRSDPVLVSAAAR
ncbi:MAG: peptide-methionine (S)-S-oxide reductase MsrA [Burkholderiales bacterium]|nr:peptide-methionine (S)-S-oxide reductase MsrA [Burkholderiales bacterium]MDE2611204.1 peptide-methionine (S)-S-oxide reductase MsrA [Burkholderiales bacterium]TAL56216.1 MAG: peptide-methionine (S)-S-oxide reductase [Pandoraea sp.]TAM19170.1 MAG: peptide-methionine (S)-S-oxide reductase [Pandoraea sp.]